MQTRRNLSSQSFLQVRYNLRCRSTTSKSIDLLELWRAEPRRLPSQFYYFGILCCFALILPYCTLSYSSTTLYYLVWSIPSVYRALFSLFLYPSQVLINVILYS